MNRLRKNIFLVVSIPAILAVMCFYIFMAAAKDNSVLYIHDLEGDRKVLTGITISGFLEDRYHGRYFEIKNGTLNSRFIYYQQKNDISGPEDYKNLVNGFMHNEFLYTYNYDYEISPGAPRKEIAREDSHAAGNAFVRKSSVYTDSVDIYLRISKRYADFFSNPDLSTVYFSPGLYFKSSGKDIEFYKEEYIVSEGTPPNTIYTLVRSSFPAVMPELAFTVLNDDLYFTIVCTKEYSGRNGIYKAVSFDPWWQNSKYLGTVETITDFDLDSTNMDFLGLEAVDNKLVLLLFENNIFKARLYNTDGRLLDELAVTGISYGEKLPYCQGFVHDGYLNVFLKYTDENQYNQITLLSIHTENGKLNLKHKFSEISSNELYPYSIIAKDNMLYTIALVKDKDETKKYYNDIFTPGHFMIYAYKTENDSTFAAYTGELVTDAVDDYNRNLYFIDTSFGHNFYDYRQFRSVDVKVDENQG